MLVSSLFQKITISVDSSDFGQLKNYAQAVICFQFPCPQQVHSLFHSVDDSLIQKLDKVMLVIHFITGVYIVAGITDT